MSSFDGARQAHLGAGLSLEVDESGIAVLEFDQPDRAYNRFTAELLERFVSLVAEVRAGAEDGEIRGLVIASGKEDAFIAGMDVEAIAGVRTRAAAVSGSRRGQLAFAALAELPVTTVAAINGTCLGGGTEMVLACDYRLAADSAAVEIGLPEVQLGIIPGFGGTQRLPRLLSLERALPMILTGQSVVPRRALRSGLVDAVVPPALLLREARAWAAGRPKRRGRRLAPEDRVWTRRLRRWLLEGNPMGRVTVFRSASKRVAAIGAHYPAPAAAIDAVRRGARRPLEEGLRIEADLEGSLVVSDVAQNLLGLFFLRQAARRGGNGGAAPVRRLGVLGAGVMGGGIAQLAAYKGIRVRVRDIGWEPLMVAMSTAYRRFDERRRSGKLDERDVQAGMGRITPTTTLRGFGGADLVIEAVVENLEVKHRVLAELEASVGDGTILATNTSSLTVASLQKPLRDPGRFVGLHFFNPVHRMPLVEVVRGPDSRPEVVAAAAAFAVGLGKVPVVVGDAPGFYVNRVLMPYLNEAMLLLAEGASIAAIDGALERYGMPMGPLRLLDEVGLDVAAKVAEQLQGAYGERLPASDISARLAQRGLRGRKGGAGFYSYPKSGKPRPDTELERELRGSAPVQESEIVDRCILPLLNEACRTLEEGIVDDPLSADLALVLGIGFAPFRGGVFRAADGMGIDAACTRLQALAARHGRRFEPAETLLRKARDGTSFYPEDWPRRVNSLGATDNA